MSAPTAPFVLTGTEKDLGDFVVRRVLPSRKRRLVGPFVFFDHMGPGELPAGRGIDVRPHPHIGLATVTYLFEGALDHRDSLGCHQTIRPGAINWMTAGRGIVHSERSGPDARESAITMHGLQLWIALPRADAETDPAFHHHPDGDLPTVRPSGDDGPELRVLLGSAYGATSPVGTFSPTLYVEAKVPAGYSLDLPDVPELAIYLVSGALTCADVALESSQMLVIDRAATSLTATEDAHFVFVGGDPIDGERIVWWNFVATSKERLEQAKRDWKEGRFPTVPGDDEEFIPLPE